MKQIILIIAFTTMQFSTANGNYLMFNELPTLKQIEKKERPPHRPFLMGAASYFIPGSGQLIMGEHAKGLSIMAMSLANTAIGLHFYHALWSDPYFEIPEYRSYVNGGLIFYVTLNVLIKIVSTVDAINTANNKNEIWKNRQNESSGLRVNPTFINASTNGNVGIMKPGLSLKYHF